MKYLATLACAAATLCLAPSAFAGDKLYPDGTWGRADEAEARRDSPRRKPLPVVEVAKDPELEPQGDRVRFRGGVSALGGAYCLGNALPGIDARYYGSDEVTSCAVIVGIEGRLGVQFNDFFGLYATPSFQVGGGGLWDVMGRVSIGLVPELTFGDVLFVGVGPELFSVDAEPGYGAFEDQAHIGVRGRAGLAFGSKRPGRRHAFTLAMDLRVDIFEENAGYAPTLSLGYDAF